MNNIVLFVCNTVINVEGFSDRPVYGNYSYCDSQILEQNNELELLGRCWHHLPGGGACDECLNTPHRQDAVSLHVSHVQWCCVCCVIVINTISAKKLKNVGVLKVEWV